MDELIKREELCRRLNLKAQTVYNMIYRKEFNLNQHYYKPNKKILLFDWTAIQEWLRGGSEDVQEPSGVVTPKPDIDTRESSLINI